MSSSSGSRPSVVPSYADLPEGVSGAGTAWQLFGEGDELGLMQLQTPERISEAVRTAQRGEVFSLSMPIGFFDPPFFAPRTPPRHTVIQRTPLGFDDVIDNFHPQGSSQIDSLVHVSAGDGMYYGGASAADVREGRRQAIDAWGQKGIVGRGVMLDVSETLGMGPGGEPKVDQRVPITVADLEAARERTGLSFRPGDILLLHTGFVDWYAELPKERRVAFAANVLNAGIEQSEEMAAYLWDVHISMIATDNVAIEAWPPDHSVEAKPFGALHPILIGEFGLALGELWKLGELAASCRKDGVYECLVVSAPIRTPGGIGSPANALAIK